MSNQLHIQTRPASLKDAKTIAELHVASKQAAYSGIAPDDYLKALAVEKLQAKWRESIQYAEPQVVVALDGNANVGFAGFDRSRDPKTKPTTGEIWAIFVAPDYWGEGAGLALWDACREGLLEEGCTEVSLWLPMRNERAMRFFDRAGFKREMCTAKTVVMGSGKVEEVRLKRPLAG
jgi:ribosomal protein S18 acetylase RimI-like enzyme